MFLLLIKGIIKTQRYTIYANNVLYITYDHGNMNSSVKRK